MPTWFSNKKNSTQSPSNDLPNEIEPSIQFLNNEKDRELYTGIYTKVTKEKHTYDRPQKGDRTLKRCIELFKQEADPEVLTKLEAFLREQIKLEKSLEKPGEYQKYHQYYIKHFLPALLRETIQSKELEKPEKPEKPEKLKTIKEIAGIISNTVKQDSKKEWNILLSKLETEITQLQKLRPEEKAERNAIIMELRISDDLNKIINESHPSAEIQEQSTNADEEIDNKILSSLNIPKEIREKYSKVMEEMMEKIKRCTKTSELGNSLGSREENKNQMQPEQAIEDTPLEKQSNNRNFHIVLVTGCILSAVGCLVTGIITAGAILFAMASAFAAAAVVTWYLTSPASELKSTNLSSPGVDGKEYKH